MISFCINLCVKKLMQDAKILRKIISIYFVIWEYKKNILFCTEVLGWRIYSCVSILFISPIRDPPWVLLKKYFFLEFGKSVESTSIWQADFIFIDCSCLMIRNRILKTKVTFVIIDKTFLTHCIIRFLSLAY